jgi:hypothetical protein
MAYWSVNETRKKPAVVATTMKRWSRDRAWSFAISLMSVTMLTIYDSRPEAYPIGVVLAPGMLIAAIFFPQGGHSDWPDAYLAVAVVTDALLFTWPVLLVWRTIVRLRNKT